MSTLQRNITALYCIKVSKWFSLIMPIIVLFYQENGLGLKEIFLLKSVYSIVSVALDIPTGYLADAWGRKKCLLAGCLIAFGGTVTYSLAYTFGAFLLAEILLGIGQSLVSGADSALLYDTMLRHRREKDYLKYEGRVIMVGNFSEALAGICGGLLAASFLRLPFYCQMGVAFIGIPAALYSDALSARLGENKTYTFILLFIVGGYLAVSFCLTHAALAILFLFYIVRGFATPILKGYINRQTFSEMRSTVLSIRNFIIRLTFALMAPFIGWLNDAFSLALALQITALAIFLPGLLFLLLQWRKE